jgi:hypothetical protein
VSIKRPDRALIIPDESDKRSLRRTNRVFYDPLALRPRDDSAGAVRTVDVGLCTFSAYTCAYVIVMFTFILFSFLVVFNSHFVRSGCTT